MNDYIQQEKGPEAHYDTPLTMNHEMEILRSVGFNEIEKAMKVSLHFKGEQI